MAAPKGNKFWEARSTHGRGKKFETPEVLWEACCEYFLWVENNPLWEQRPFSYQGDITMATVYKMRAMTITGLCLFLGISQECWGDYRERKGFSEIATRVDAVIREQKFTGAAAGLLDANIIARDLGLKDKQDVEHSGGMVVEIVKFGDSKFTLNKK